MSNNKDKLLEPPLRAIAIEINSACNRRCRWCPNHDNIRKEAYLADDLFHKIVLEVSKLSLQKITFNLYNEPLLDKRLPQFISYVRGNMPKVTIYLNTNGDLLNLEKWRELRRKGLNHANISL